MKSRKQPQFLQRCRSLARASFWAFSLLRPLHRLTYSTRPVLRSAIIHKRSRTRTSMATDAAI